MKKRVGKKRNLSISPKAVVFNAYINAKRDFLDRWEYVRTSFRKPRKENSKKSKDYARILQIYNSDFRDKHTSPCSINYIVESIYDIIDTKKIKKYKTPSTDTIRRALEPQILRDYPHLKKNKKSFRNES